MAIETWPAGLPVPQKSFSCQLRAGLSNDQSYIYPQRTRTYPERISNFSLVLTQTEFEALQTFYQTTLKGGGELFTADWLEDGGFEYHRLRFLKPFEASLKDGVMWKVKMNLEIIAGVPFDGADAAYWPCEEGDIPAPTVILKIRFLIDCTQGGVSHSNIAMAEVELRDVLGGEDETTATGGTATASGNIGPGYVASKAVDDNNVTMWNSAFTAGVSWWAFEFTSELSIVQYSITSRASYLDDSPTEWRVQAWIGDAWVTVETESTTADWGSNEKRVFLVDLP